MRRCTSTISAALLFAVAIVVAGCGPSRSEDKADAARPSAAFAIEDKRLLQIRAHYVDGSTFEYVELGLPNATDWGSEWVLRSDDRTVVFRDHDGGSLRHTTVSSYTIDASTIRIMTPDGALFFAGTWAAGPDAGQFTVTRTAPSASYATEPGDPQGLVFFDDKGSVVATTPLPPISAPEVTSFVLREVHSLPVEKGARPKTDSDVGVPDLGVYLARF